MTKFGTPQHFLEIEKLCQDKDAEIDRLRYEADRWKHVAANKWGIDDLQKYQAEIDRLRAELDQCRAWLKYAYCHVDSITADKVKIWLSETAKEGK